MNGVNSFVLCGNRITARAVIRSTAFLVFFIAIAREASPSGLYERRRTYPGAGRSHLKRTAQAAPSGKPTGAALALVARETLGVSGPWYLTTVGKFMSRNQTEGN